jgi:hypothetical protein
LEEVWQRVCVYYDVSADMPGMHDLFAGAPLNAPARAAEAVMVNMITEVMQWVCRFSPWYTKPAQAYGLAMVRSSPQAPARWRLTAEATCRWRAALDALDCEVSQSRSTIQMLMMLDELIEDVPGSEICVPATCACTPPRVILIVPSVLHKNEIICDECCAVFRVVFER